MYDRSRESDLCIYFKKEKESTWAKIQQKSPFRFFCDWTTLLCLPDYKANVYYDWSIATNLPGYQNQVKFHSPSRIIFLAGIILIGRVFLVCPVTIQINLSWKICIATAVRIRLWEKRVTPSDNLGHMYEKCPHVDQLLITHSRGKQALLKNCTVVHFFNERPMLKSN